MWREALDRVLVHFCTITSWKWSVHPSSAFSTRRSDTLKLTKEQTKRHQAVTVLVHRQFHRDSLRERSLFAVAADLRDQVRIVEESFRGMGQIRPQEHL